MNPWAILAAVLALGGALGASYMQGRRDGSSAVIASQEKARIESEAAASAERAKSAANTFRIQENRDAENLRTGDQLADALRRLRISAPVRAAAVPASGAGACPDRELPVENREALLRLGAEADRLRADYRACREFVDSLK